MRTRHEEMRITLDFTEFPIKHTCDGENTSPQVNVSGLSHPYFALIIDDSDARGFAHWLIWDIRSTDTIPEGISKTARPPELPGSVQGVNSTGDLGYFGPCPPPGGPHHYHLKAYGLEAPLDLEPGATKADLVKALDGRASQFSDFVAIYKR